MILFINQAKIKNKDHLTEKHIIEARHKNELLSTQLEMQLQTMQHIGREIHDNVGQKLTLASLYTQQLSYENKVPLVTDKITDIINIINESLQELRRLSKSLTDDGIAQQNLVGLLKQECEKIKGTQDFSIHFSSSSQNIDADYETKSILLRVLQEFLQNSIKHSKCSLITIELSQIYNNLFLLMEDDGVGFDSTQTSSSGIGLKNIANRIALVNGSFTLNSKPGNGTSLQITIPLSHEI